jgi:hypothetical protein
MCISHWISLSNKLTPFFSLCAVEFSSRTSLAQQLQYRMARRKQNTIPPCPWHLMYRAGPSASYAGFFKRQKNKHKDLHTSICEFHLWNWVHKKANMQLQSPARPCKHQFILDRQKLKHSQEVNLMHSRLFRHAQTLPAWLKVSVLAFVK